MDTITPSSSEEPNNSKSHTPTAAPMTASSSSPSPLPASEPDHSATIDSLLQRYLSLLDEYTKLRASLNALQSAMYQNLARANFSAERGIRYGQGYFDERMQAGRRVKITVGGNPESDSEPGGGGLLHPLFEVVAVRDIHLSSSTAASTTEDKGKEEKQTTSETETEKVDAKKKEEDDQQEEGKPKGQQPKPPSSDPLRWFGLLTPSSLRQAQSQAIQAVEDIMPRLLAVSTEMSLLEVEVRRARKKRAKAEAAAEKQQRKLQQEQEQEREIEQAGRRLEGIALQEESIAV